MTGNAKILKPFPHCSSKVPPKFSHCSSKVLPKFPHCSSKVPPLFFQSSPTVLPKFPHCAPRVLPTRRARSNAIRTHIYTRTYTYIQGSTVLGLVWVFPRARCSAAQRIYIDPYSGVFAVYAVYAVFDISLQRGIHSLMAFFFYDVAVHQYVNSTFDLCSAIVIDIYFSSGSYEITAKVLFFFASAFEVFYVP